MDNQDLSLSRGASCNDLNTNKDSLNVQQYMLSKPHETKEAKGHKVRHSMDFRDQNQLLTQARSSLNGQ